MLVLDAAELVVVCHRCIASISASSLAVQAEPAIQQGRWLTSLSLTSPIPGRVASVVRQDMTCEFPLAHRNNSIGCNCCIRFDYRYAC